MPIFYQVPQAHAVIIERLGKFAKIQYQGFHMRIPILEQIRKVDTWGGDANKRGFEIELSEQQSDTPIRKCHTKDNVEVNVNASVYWKITDPSKALYEIDVLPKSIPDISLNALRANVGKLLLDELLSERQRLTELIFAQLKEATSKWGVQITRAEIQELSTTDATADAMRQEMAAEREKRALILQSDGQKQAEITIAEGHAKAVEIKALAQAKAISMIAQAEQGYLKRLKEEVGESHAAQVVIAQKYIDGMNQISKNPADKVFLPASFGGVFSVSTDTGGSKKPSEG